MCGIAGLAYFGVSLNEHQLQSYLVATDKALAHRGPDGAGYWVDVRREVALVQRRLSIIDLTEAGAQPFVSENRRYILVYNGEIYNYRELRRELLSKGCAFRGDSDTEVLLRMIERQGVEGTLARIDGMFAFALYDTQQRCLFLARDRFGEKPLYYTLQRGRLAFGSELRAVVTGPEISVSINQKAVQVFLQLNYIPAPLSIYSEVMKLPAGCVMRVNEAGIHLERYWKLSDLYYRTDLLYSDAEYDQVFEALLENAAKRRMVADVPVGAFLSGGIDSAAIAAAMQVGTGKKVRTFTIGYGNPVYNEAGDARKVASALGTDHSELIVTPQDALGVIPRLSRIFDEPFADSSQIPTLLISQLARKQVKVALTGDAGDELFGGYNRYFWGSRLWRTLRRFPISIRRAIALRMQQVRPEVWDRIYWSLQRYVTSSAKLRSPGEQVHKLASILDSHDETDFYGKMISRNMFGQHLFADTPAMDVIREHLESAPEELQFVERMMFTDLLSYLPDDNLCKLDRVTMSVGLEGRVPMLDLELVRFACSLPVRQKIRNGVGKVLIRRYLASKLPQIQFSGPKRGFGIPLSEWLRHDLRDWADSLLTFDKLEAASIPRPELTMEAWMQHKAGNANQQYLIWPVLVLVSWLQGARNEGA
jgi:asparagine synthase (glutamine-hydrolysing)